MRDEREDRLLVYLYVAARLGAFVTNFTGLLALIIFHRLPLWAWRTWVGAFAAFAVTSLVLYGVRKWRKNRRSKRSNDAEDCVTR